MEHNRNPCQSSLCTHAISPDCMRICPIFIYIQICIYSDANVKKCTWIRCIRMHKNKIKLHKHSTANKYMCVYACGKYPSSQLMFNECCATYSTHDLA